MSYIHVDSPDKTGDLRSRLDSSSRIALDCEAAGFHRYSDRLCLVQITADGRTFLVDALAFDPSELLKAPLERPDLRVVMHGADFDLRLLRRDLGIELRGLFDTQVAAALLGVESFGLAALLEGRFGVRLSKKYQRADWATRPLTPEMLEYAADDTRHLLELADQLSAELVASGRESWVEEECRALEDAAAASDEPDEPVDPVVKVRGARDLSDRQVTALREALDWRDAIARERDRAVFRVVGDAPLVEAVARGPRRVEDLADVKGFPAGLARGEGRDLLERLERVRQMPASELRPYPRRSGRGLGRPPVEVEELAEKLKAVRNRKSAEVGLPRGTLLSNAVVMAVARAAPPDLESLSAIDGMRRWKMELLGRELLAVIRGAA